VKRFWYALLAIQAIAVVAFYFAVTSSDYLVRMPPSVRLGASVEEWGLRLSAYLVGIISLVDVSVWAWIKGVEWRQRDPRLGFMALGASVIVFLLACVSLVAFVVFGFAQY
jgi:hypothetical protein